ncbi:hypothetical protein PBOR_29735 [Paenibacillus borealis]|uniref:Uncharacterized protein n=1 Tax=Paenibacillus borealis TaxID=160799 RepID=A0A089LKM5_PAEBO|nr:hypothetical protein PBOR_29735 [Paenibacillus borealis]
MPRVIILLYSANVLIGIIDYILIMNIPVARGLEDGSSLRDLIRAALTCALWMAYFRKLERVKKPLYGKIIAEVNGPDFCETLLQQ